MSLPCLFCNLAHDMGTNNQHGDRDGQAQVGEINAQVHVRASVSNELHVVFPATVTAAFPVPWRTLAVRLSISRRDTGSMHHGRIFLPD